MSSRPLVGAALPQFGPNLVTNGDFSAGTTGWLEFATPNQSFMVSSTSGGVYQFFRQPPPAGTSNQATLFQETGAAVPAHTALTAQFDLGNSSTVRKRISVLVLNSDFADLSVCTFFLEPQTALRTYQMRTHSTRPWTNAAIYFFAATTLSNGGFYLIDNVSLRTDTSASATRTECHDPSVPPGIPGGGGGQLPPSLLGNGDFGTGTLPPWGLFGQIVGQIVNGVFEFHRPPGTPSGTILQPTGIALPARELIVASFQLGNSSTVRKRVTVILHDADFSDLSACTFFLAPGQPLSDYGMRSYTTKAWASATFSLFPATVGLEASIRLDNVTLRQSVAQGATGTECFEPLTPLAIALSPATLGIPTQAQGTLTASISAPAPGGGTTINLLSSDTNVATVPASVVVPAGQMTVPITVTTSTGTGGATITATSPGLAPATATIANALRTMTLDVTNPNLTIGNPVNGTVTLVQAAPAGGASITLVSSDPNVSVTSPVAIGPGATQGSFVVTANAAVANATITGSAPGFANATLTLTAGFRIWTANASGFWDVAANWQDGIVPANGDSVLIDRPAAITVTVRVPTAAINTLQANEALTINSTLTVNGQAFFDGGLTLGGLLTGTGAAQIRSAGVWTSATVSIASVVVAAGQTLTISTAGNHILLNSTLQNDGTIAWTGTQLRLTDSSVQNNNVFTTASGPLTFEGASSVINASGAVWDVQGNLIVNSLGGGTQSLTNGGLLRRSSGMGAFSITGPVVFANTGTLEIQTGSFSNTVAAGWTTSGPLIVAAGATVSLSGATLQAGTTINGGGALQLGPTAVVPDLTLTQATTLNGNLTGPGKLTMAAPLTWAGGTIVGSGLTIGVGQTLTLNGSGNQRLQNSTLQNNGTFAWIVSSQLRLTDSSVQNNSVFTTASGPLTFEGASSVINASGAVWDVQGNLIVNSLGGGTQTITNGGLLRRSGGTGALSITGPVVLANSGTLEIQTGSFSNTVAAGWTTSGSLIVAAGATLSLSGATLQAGTTINGGGALQLGPTTIVPDLTLTQATTLSGNLTGPGKLTMAGPLTWSAGTVTNSGITIQAGQTLTLGSPGSLTNSPFVNHGTINWPVAGQLTISNGSLQNTGTINAGNNGGNLTLTNSTLTNTGTVTTSGAITLDGASSLTNAVSATWTMVGGAVSPGASAGSKTVTNDGVFRRGGALGNWTIGSQIGFTNTGTVELRLGGLSVGQFDRLVLGSATLGGTLDVKLTNGFVPSTSDSFAVATYTSLSGSFATILGNGHTYTPTYGATTLTITKQ